MNSMQHAHDELTHTLDMVIPAERLTALYQGFLLHKQKDYKLPGFRPGKVPLNLVNEAFGKKAWEYATETVASEAIQEVIKEKQWNLAAQPSCDNVHFDEEKGLSFKATFNLMPQMPDVDIHSLPLSRYTVHVEDQAVEAALGELAARHPVFKDLEEDRGAQMGDRLTVDLAIQLKTRVEQEGLEDISFQLGAGFFIPDLEKRLVGARAGDVIDHEGHFPENLKKRRFAGKPFVVKVTLKKVEASHPHPIDEELAQQLKADTLEEVREAIKQRLQNQAQAAALTLLREDLWQHLDKAVDFSLPSDLLSAQETHVLQQVFSQVQGARTSSTEEEGERIQAIASHFSVTPETVKETLTAMARRQLKKSFLIGHLAHVHGLNVSQEELNQVVNYQIQENPARRQEILHYYQNVPHAVEELRHTIFEQKLLSLVEESLKNATEKSWTYEELEAELRARSLAFEDLLKGEKAPSSEAAQEAKKSQAKQSEESSKPHKPAGSAKKSKK